VLDVRAGFRAHLEYVGGVEADQVFDLLRDVIRARGGQIGLVDDSDHFEVLLERHVQICERLGFDALGAVHDQQRAFARLEGAADLVGEIDMPRRIDQVHFVRLAVMRGILHAHCGRLYRHAALALEIHRVEHLLLHVAVADSPGQLEQTISQRALAMIDMGDDREITDFRDFHQYQPDGSFEL